MKRLQKARYVLMNAETVFGKVHSVIMLMHKQLHYAAVDCKRIAEEDDSLACCKYADELRNQLFELLANTSTIQQRLDGEIESIRDALMEAL